MASYSSYIYQQYLSTSSLQKSSALLALWSPFITFNAGPLTFAHEVSLFSACWPHGVRSVDVFYYLATFPLLFCCPSLEELSQQLPED